jgi:hypothetical protein
MKSAQPAARTAVRVTVADRFRGEIEQAASEGVALEELALHLTLGDVEQLKRDRAVALADISFTGGTMTYLGVTVVKGNVPQSALRRQAADGA